MQKDELLKLAERVEALSGPDSQLDDEIAEALFTGKHRVCVKGLSDEAGGMWMFTYPDGSIGSALRFTASLDAAMTLVPEGWDHGYTWRRGSHPHMKANGQCWTQKEASTVHGDAATPALALCAAALRALAGSE